MQYHIKYYSQHISFLQRHFIVPLCNSHKKDFIYTPPWKPFSVYPKMITTHKMLLRGGYHGNMKNMAASLHNASSHK